MIIIGEKINGSRKRVAQAIREGDAQFIQNLARAQYEGGAAYLDINAGTHPQQEPDDMIWLLENVQRAAPEAKICLDSANPEALKAGIAHANGPVMINSLSGEQYRIDGVLPLALEHQTELIILPLDEKKIQPTAEGRMAIVRRLVDMTRAGGLGDEKLYVDPLVMAISTGTENGNVTLETCRMIRAEFPLVHLTCGLSNISFGMPLRTLINQTFLAMAIQAGLDSAIMNPEEREMRGAIYAAELLLGRDRHCMNFNRTFRAGKIGPRA